MALTNTHRVTNMLWRMRVTNEDRARDPELHHLPKSAPRKRYTRDRTGLRVIFPKGALDDGRTTQWQFVPRG